MSSSYTFHRSLIKGFFYLGRGGGHVLASYSNNMSWNAAEVYYFYREKLVVKDEKQARNIPILKTFFVVILSEI